MKIAAILLPIVAVVVVVLVFRSDSGPDRLQTRRYEISAVLLFGGENEQQQRLHGFYRAALDAGRDDLIRRTFEGAGVQFPEGTTAILNPADTHLYVRHHASVLDEIESEFSIHGTPYRPPSRVRLFIEDVLERIGIRETDPFAHISNYTARTSCGTPTRSHAESKSLFSLRGLIYHSTSAPRIESSAL